MIISLRIILQNLITTKQNIAVSTNLPLIFILFLLLFFEVAVILLTTLVNMATVSVTNNIINVFPRINAIYMSYLALPGIIF